MTGFQRFFNWLLLAFLAILSISGTIALRNLLHVILLGMVLWVLLWSRDRQVGDPIGLARKIPRPLYALCVFLLLFPIWAPEPEVAWFNLRGQWGELILTWLLAWGSVVVLGQGRPGLWTLALASGVPVYLHLVLTGLAWAGLLRPVFYEDPSLAALWSSITELALDMGLWRGPLPAFPMGFPGVEPMHGNLGYAASQTTAIALACACAAWKKGDSYRLAKASVLVAVCFLSVLIARSRGAVYFSIFLMAMAPILYAAASTSARYRQRLVGQRPVARHIGYGLASLVGVLLLLGTFFHVSRSDPRWYSMWDKVELGWVIEKAMPVLCEGLSVADVENIRATHPDRGPVYGEILKDGMPGDGSRVLMMRAGLELALRHPWGLDGSRQAYQKRMAQACGHPPTLAFAHAHQGWLNLALSLGWLGMVLFAGVLVMFAVKGWRMMASRDTWPVGLALLLLAVFWILRGMVDAVYQEHYLQMQAFMLLFLCLSSGGAKVPSKR